MRLRWVGLLALVVFVAACGADDPSAPVGEDSKKGREGETETVDEAAEEPETLVGTFITSEGEHPITPDGKFVIHIVREGELLGYRFEVRTVAEEPRPGAAGTERVERSTTSGSETASIAPNSKWFVHVESPERYWVYDGDDDVTLIEYSESSPTKLTVSMTDLESMSERLLKEMPDAVKKRIPSEVLARRK